MSARQVGSVQGRTGTLVIADTFTLDQVWCVPSKAHGQWAFDVIGERAQYLATRCSSGRPVTELADGTRRVICPNVQIANIMRSHTQSLVEQEGIKATVHVHPLWASSALAKDATRKDDAGLVERHEAVAFQIPQHSSIRAVTHRDSEGRLREIRILLD